MASKALETERRDESFWREFPTMADYFAPGILPLLKYLDLDSKLVMHEFGEQLGRRAAAKTADLSLDEMLDEFARVWQAYKIGTLAVESHNPLTIQLSNCTVCGQLEGTGDMFECAFHEGFFQGALGARLGKAVKIRQETNFAGDAGTWCRRLVLEAP
jgi:predicted hydrocarbon binding protein